MGAQSDFNSSKFYHLVDYVNQSVKASKDPLIHAALTQLRVVELAIFARLDELADKDD